MENNNKYDDIINLPHHISTDRPRMSMHDRAAQFSPFAALTGYGDAVEETARFTDTKLELDDDVKYMLNEKLRLIKEHLSDCPVIQIIYFKADKSKLGGEYISKIGSVKKIDEYGAAVVMTDKTKIPIDDIAEINGSLFDGLWN